MNGPFAEQLGLEMTEDGDIATKAPFCESVNVPGVFAVGDCGAKMKTVTQAVAAGTFCAGGLAMQLQVELEEL